jgi:4-hydroxy-tetrahydrodipicolinate reductase
MNIALVGYGKMGKAIEALAIERGHKIIAKIGRDGFTPSEIAMADVCIEFSRPEAGFKNIQKCILAGKPVISGTTGWVAKMPEMKAFVKENDGSFFYASNFSLGVNVFFAVNQYLAKIMNHFNEYEVAVHEVHHTQKLDAPSGTAITIAQQIVKNINRKKGYALDATAKDMLNITADRVDPAPGTHHVKYSSPIDDIEIIHTAHNRLGFATGAVLAAEWLIGKTGSFGMEDMLKLNDLK